MTILVADDQPLFLEMLCTIIETYDGFRVVARATNGEEAVALYTQHKPDVCLLDLQMPVLDGIGALKRIKAISDNAKVIILTTFSDDGHVLEACHALADGYILKDIKPDILAIAIRCVYSGLICMNKNVLPILNEKISELEQLNPQAQGNKTGINFNPKDIEIMRLIGEGLSNRMIAEKLNYSEGTIRNRISAILAETGLADRTQIALFALKNKMV